MYSKWRGCKRMDENCAKFVNVDSPSSVVHTIETIEFKSLAWFKRIG